MGSTRLVVADGAEFFVELADGGGPSVIGAAEALSFDGVRSTLEGVAAELAKAWEKVQPDEATVGFGIKLTAKSGKLTGLIVDGGGEAALTVTLKWTAGTAPA